MSASGFAHLLIEVTPIWYRSAPSRYRVNDALLDVEHEAKQRAA